MNKILLIVSLIISTSCNAQIFGKKVESFTLSNGTTVNEGDVLHLGRGSDRNGNFVYAFWPQNAIVGTSEEPLDKTFAGKILTIKYFRIQGNERNGYKTIAVCKSGINSEVDIESAISAGEILKINNTDVTRSGGDSTEATQNFSVADEIAKLKKLKDEGVITEDEFEQQKKKLLEK